MEKAKRRAPKFTCGQEVFYVIREGDAYTPRRGTVEEVIIREYGVFYRFRSECTLIKESDIAETSQMLLRHVSASLKKAAKETMRSVKEWTEKNDPKNWFE